MTGILAAEEPSSYFCSRLTRAKAGDYIVTSQPGCYCVLLIRSHEGNKIILEEIDIPDYAVDTKKMDWKTWILSRAPGNTSWIYLEIDLAEQKLLDAYSVSRRSFLQLSEDEQFFLKLLSLPTQRLHNDIRRKIGPPPLAGEPDFRKIWQPKIRFEGVSRNEPTTVFRAEWPRDSSVISGSRIDFYYDDRLPDFAFPTWIEISTSHLKAHMAVIEAGRNLTSPAPNMPMRPPKILKMPEIVGESFVMEVRCIEDFEKIDLFAIEAGGPLKPGIRLLYEMERVDKETLRFLIPKTLVDDKLQIGHHYRLALAPFGHPECYTETESTFAVINNDEQ